MTAGNRPIGAQDMGSYPILTPRNLHSAECRGDCLADRIDRALLLHREEYDRICTTCRETWPCDTWRALADDVSYPHCDCCEDTCPEAAEGSLHTVPCKTPDCAGAVAS